MAYVFLKAFAETRNLRHWEAKSDQLTRSDKNHSQTQVTQSHFLTLSDVWHKMAYDFLKAFVKTRNLRRWKAKSERESFWIVFALFGYMVTSKVHSGEGLMGWDGQDRTDGHMNIEPNSTPESWVGVSLSPINEHCWGHSLELTPKGYLFVKGKVWKKLKSGTF